MVELKLKTYDELTALAANILATWMSGDHVIDCLNQEKFEIEAALKRVNAGIAALDAHPELEQFIDTLQQAGI